MRPLIIYHGGGCTDGFCAAWLFHEVWPDAEFLPAQYGDDPPEVSGREVYVVDFSYPRDVMIQMAERAAQLRVLDHHKTAKEACEGLSFCTFDLGKSGARLALDFICQLPPHRFPGAGWVRLVTWLVDYTEDRDLWRFNLPESAVINCAIRSYPQTFKAWKELMFRSTDELVIEGQAISRYRDRVVEQHLEHAREVELMGHHVKIVPCTTGEIMSEIAGRLAEDAPFAACYFDTEDGYRVFSLRSRDGGIDVSEIAKRAGGGGHPQAAGFKVPI